MNFINVSDIDIQNFYKKVANNIKKIRKKKKITQLDLALTIGHKSVSTIAKIEAGIENKHYNLEHIYKISKALDVNLTELIEE